jgi:tRNA uracil 4-sulfurtransferase
MPALRDYAIVHYHEIGLKGGNRAYFERALVRNIERALSDIVAVKVKRLPGRLLVPLPSDADGDAVSRRLRDIFGIANIGLATGGQGLDIEALSDLAWIRAQERDFATFAIRGRKAHSDFPLSTREINEKVGAFVLERSGKRVNLDEPDLTVFIEIVGDLALVSNERLPGPGGLPVGVSGRSVVMLSAGIDSPVAAWRMMRRGSRCVFVHFHSQPFTDASSARQAAELAGMLTRFQYDANLWLVPLAPAQQQIAALCPDALRTLLYRRMMTRIACAIAAREGAKAIVTGDSLGQVASQTMENLAVVEDASTLPMLRPLIGRDKLEIVAEATSIGTFEVSSAPHQEACVLFEPKRPATKASIEACRDAEVPLDTDALVAEAVDGAEVRRLRFPENPVVVASAPRPV